MNVLRLAWLAFPALAGCSYAPARFADRVPVTEIADDRAIPIPRKTPFIEPFYLSDVYLRRPIVDALDTERFPYAQDVNALDDVPRSSWFDPPPLEPAAFERAYARSGLPRPPARLDPAGAGDFSFTDARGRSYTLEGDLTGLPATSTAAQVIATRLARAVGYRTPGAWLVKRESLGLPAGAGPKSARLVALGWPIGVELGPTDMTYPRDDDPNDRISHRDRRTLRSLGVFAAWLGLTTLGPSHLVDVYVGRPGRGHVEHFLVGLDVALGASALGTSHAELSVAGVVRGSPLTNLATLGLARDGAAPPRFTTLEVFSRDVKPDYELSQPWEPVDRLLPSDGYWMAKRIAAVPSALIDAAITAAELPPSVASHVKDALENRRRTLLRHWYARVSPLEVETLSGRTLVLRDEAMVRDVAEDAVARYEVRFLGADGGELAPPVSLGPSVGEVEIVVPALERDYIVLAVTAIRGEKRAPRAAEFHFVRKDAGLRLVGVRH